MNTELFPFQDRAVDAIHKYAYLSSQSYSITKKPQIISLTAPTGAGKTIIMASFIEKLFFGSAEIPERPEAIVVWLSDSPELNQQSKDKIDTRSNKLTLGQTVTIEDDSFKDKILEDGHIYFLNTQKLSKTSNLTKHSDTRQYTIWEVLKNTVEEKGDHLFFIIDEAHRGMIGKDAARATTIMQKFIKGSPEEDLPQMPVIIGMTATSQRFNELLQQTNITVNYHHITPDEVRDSGLLKDRIIISYPEASSSNRDISVLHAAAVEWKDKWNHWFQYCVEQHYAHVYPVLIIQVLNGTSDNLTDTDLAECLREIEHSTGESFITGEVVHTFGNTTSDIECNGIKIKYLEPSRISDDRNVKVVFFKENLSTGWDCPRAETMMSFRHAEDYTYIAQLLGRMIRTPLQMRVRVDDSLNEVHLYLPYFNATTVQEVIDYLQNAEGGSLADIESEEIGSSVREILSISSVIENASTSEVASLETEHEQTESDGDKFVNEPFESTKYIDPILVPGESNMDDSENKTPSQIQNEQEDAEEKTEERSNVFDDNKTEEMTEESSSIFDDNKTDKEATSKENTKINTTDKSSSGLSSSLRLEIINAINKMGLTTYTVRKAQVRKKLYSLIELASLIKDAGISKEPLTESYNIFISEIDSYVSQLKENGKYDELARKAVYFKLTTQIFDVLKNESRNSNDQILYTSASDIDKQFRVAEKRLGDFGIGKKYGIFLNKKYGDATNFKTDVILYVASSPDKKIEEIASEKFYELTDKYRRNFAGKSDEIRKRFDKITADADVVSCQNFELPKAIESNFDAKATKYYDHMYINPQKGYAQIALNNWESLVLKEEQERDDYICWIRNMPRKSWALTIPYEIGNETKSTYPDLIIVRKENNNYIVDILEPHDPTRNDNLPKAKAFAKYAKANNTILGHIELIRQAKDNKLNGQKKFLRLDMCKSEVAEKVLKATNNDELDSLFNTYGTER